MKISYMGDDGSPIFFSLAAEDIDLNSMRDVYQHLGRLIESTATRAHTKTQLIKKMAPSSEEGGTLKAELIEVRHEADAQCKAAEEAQAHAQEAKEILAKKEIELAA